MATARTLGDGPEWCQRLRIREIYNLKLKIQQYMAFTILLVVVIMYYAYHFEAAKIEDRKIMPSSRLSQAPRGSKVVPPIGGCDSARYTKDLLEILKEMAIRQGHMVLTRLLEAAAYEAERIALD